MIATFHPRHFSAELFSYAEDKKVFEIFQNVLEKFSVDRPEKPLEYLYDLLTKEAVYDVPKVYALGPPSVERTLLCTAMALKLDLMLINWESLAENDTAQDSAPNDWINLVKKRVEMPDCTRKGWILEGFPQSRSEAFLLRKKGVFPTHIVLIEPDDLLNMEMSDEMQTYIGQITLILDLHRNSYLKKFIIDGDVNSSTEKVIEFVRSKMHPPMPYLPRVLLLGPYGSSRKTVAKELTKKYNLVEINYQQELRKAAMKDSPVKERLCEILKMSNPIPDDLLVEIASERLMQKDCIENGWVMYNFPDTAKQAELLTKALKGFQVNRVIFLKARFKTCLNRVEPRRFDPDTGKIYNLKANPYLEDSLMERLMQLPQDSAESVEAEYRFFVENEDQLKLFFRQKLTDDITIEVDANGLAEDTFEAVQGAILKSAKMKISES